MANGLKFHIEWRAKLGMDCVVSGCCSNVLWRLS